MKCAWRRNVGQAVELLRERDLEVVARDRLVEAERLHVVGRPRRSGRACSRRRCPARDPSTVGRLVVGRGRVLLAPLLERLDLVAARREAAGRPRASRRVHPRADRRGSGRAPPRASRGESAGRSRSPSRNERRSPVVALRAGDLEHLALVLRSSSSLPDLVDALGGERRRRVRARGEGVRVGARRGSTRRRRVARAFPAYSPLEERAERRVRGLHRRRERVGEARGEPLVRRPRATSSGGASAGSEERRSRSAGVARKALHLRRARGRRTTSARRVPTRARRAGRATWSSKRLRHRLEARDERLGVVRLDERVDADEVLERDVQAHRAGSSSHSQPWWRNASRLLRERRGGGSRA